jgi:hypothetical protein
MKTLNRSLAEKNGGYKKERIIPCWLRDWLRSVFDRTLKAFFDALFDHYAP